MVPSIVVVDYGMGNRRSVEKALLHVGADATVTSSRDLMIAADALVLPGVGAFPKGMERLHALGLDSLIRDRVADGTPLLGICLGMQLLFESSTELGDTTGLGLLEGQVRALRAPGLRLPHIGWSEVRFEQSSPLSKGLPATSAPFYHVHSYVACPTRPENVVGTAEYGERFATIVARDDVFGVQFHPEKSSRDGLRLLTDFCTLAADRRLSRGSVTA
jgi:imidazole glycerol-phosphate synthase subunit HisH